MGCFSGHLMSSAIGQKLFFEVCSAFKCSFNKFVGEKVVFPSHSSAILAPPRFIVLPSWKWANDVQINILSFFFHSFARMVSCSASSSSKMSVQEDKLVETELSQAGFCLQQEENK